MFEEVIAMRLHFMTVHEGAQVHRIVFMGSYDEVTIRDGDYTAIRVIFVSFVVKN